jgi:hypothetical protein
VKTTTAAYEIERVKLQTQPVAFARFYHVKKYGDGTDYAFSVDFSTDAVASPTSTKKAMLFFPSGHTQTIEHENGRSSIGIIPLRFQDMSGEFLKYLAAPALTVGSTMTPSSPANGGSVNLGQDPGGLPAKGTIEIVTGGVVERIRYTGVNTAGDQVTGITRGVDGTVAASHAIGDAVTNGEQIRPGQRVQLFFGYAPIAEADYMADVKREVTRRAMPGQDGVTYEVQCSDIQRSLRRTIFLAASVDAPVILSGNPITLALQILTSTGLANNGAYDVLPAVNGLGVPQALVDTAGLEALRAAEFPSDTYVFSLTDREDGKTFIEEQLWKTLNVYPVVKQDGRYSAKRYKQTGASVMTLDEASIIGWSWAMGDQEMINVVEVEYDWDLEGARGVYSKTQIYTADLPTGRSSIDKYGRRPPLGVSAKGIRTASGGQAILDNRAFEVVKRFAEPPLTLTLDVFYSKHVLEAGDNITVTHSGIPNPRTGLRGLTSELFQIINFSFGEGRVRIQLLWINDIPAQSAPTSGGAVTQPGFEITDTTAPAFPTGLGLATGTVIAPDGTVQVFLDASWNANAEVDLDYYELQFRRQGDTNFTTRFIRKGTQANREVGVIGNITYEAKIRAVDISGNPSAFSTIVTIVTAQDVAAPGTPTSVTGAGGSESSLIRWTNPTADDFDRVEIWRHTANDRGPSTKVGESRGTTFFDEGLLQATTYYYWLRAIDFSGNQSAFHAGDTSGLTITTSGKIGYKLTLEADPFTGTFVDSVGTLSMAVDTTDREIDWLIRQSGDLHFGETTAQGFLATALGLKFSGETFVATEFDGTNVQVATILSGVVRWGRLDKDGGVVTALADKFTPGANDSYVRAVMSRQGSSIYWAILKNVGSPFTECRVMFARTSLTGTVEVSPVDITGANFPQQGQEVRIGTDSEGNSHILWQLQSALAFQADAFQNDAFQIATSDTMKYVKVNNAGTVLIAVSVPFSPAPGSSLVSPAAVLVDTFDAVHVLAYSYFGTGLTLSYGRMTKAAVLVVPLVLFFALPTAVRFAWGAMDRGNNQIYAALATTAKVTQLRLDPVDPTGVTEEATMLQVPL